MDGKTGVAEPILLLKDLKKYFSQKRGLAFWRRQLVVRAVDGISLRESEGETVGLVGESGCGKSTIGKVILKVLNPSSGQVWFMGKEVSQLRGRDLDIFRRHVQAVYQDPYASLNPRMRVDHIIGEPISNHKLLYGKAKRKRVAELLEKVGLSSDHARCYPHEFSGGQRQRIGIARALAANPKFILLDEPVSALDVSVRAQILNLLIDLQEEFRLTYLFISHDLSVVEYICDHILVMYLGKIMEQATKSQLFTAPAHPYTRALLSAVPIPDPERVVDLIPITGEIPSPLNPPAGCRFHTRCPSRMEVCEKDVPLMNLIEEGHTVYCHLFK